MAEVKDQLEIKFRLNDGSGIGPRFFPNATTVATLKETVVAQWPRDKENGPKTVKDLKLISSGRILENNKTVGDYRNPVCNIAGAVTTMHVIIQPQVIGKEKKKKKPKDDLKERTNVSVYVLELGVNKCCKTSRENEEKLRRFRFYS